MVEMGIALDVVAAVIGHTAGDKDTHILRRHYVHTDLLELKADALQRWDQRLKAIVTGEEAAKVVRLPRAGVMGRQFVVWASRLGTRANVCHPSS